MDELIERKLIANYCDNWWIISIIFKQKYQMTCFVLYIRIYIFSLSFMVKELRSERVVIFWYACGGQFCSLVVDWDIWLLWSVVDTLLLFEVSPILTENKLNKVWQSTPVNPHLTTTYYGNVHVISLSLPYFDLHLPQTANHREFFSSIISQMYYSKPPSWKKKKKKTKLQTSEQSNGIISHH